MNPCWKSFGLVLLFIYAWNVYAQQAPQTFTLDGQLFSNTAGTTPLVSSGVSVTVQILEPTNQTCILYEETQTVDTSTTNGYFTLQVGSLTTGSSATKRGANDVGNAMATVYSNTITTTNGKLVSGGTACTYNPASGDVRYVRITVTPPSSTTQVFSPNLTLDSSPNAIVAERAETLQGMLPSALLQVNNSGSEVLSQSNLENVFSTTNYTALTALLSGSSPNYIPSTGAVSLSGNTTIAAGNNLTMASGAGVFSQTYTGTTTSASTLTANSVTTANVESVTANGLTSGSILNLSSSSTAAATGNTGLNISITGANATSGVTRYGIQSSVTATGTNSTNVAGYFTASGGTNNYGLIVGSGSVGIGTSAPAYTLDVNGTFHTTSTAAFENNSATSTGPTFSFWKSRAYANTQANDSLGYFNYFGYDSTLRRGAYIAAFQDSVSSGSLPTDLTFATAGPGNADAVERMRISASGSVGIGTTSPQAKLDVWTGNLNLTNDGQFGEMGIHTAHPTGAGYPWFSTYQSRGTIASPTYMQQWDTLGGIGFYNHNAKGIEIRARATENHSSSNAGSRFDFYITPNGTNTQSAAFEIDQSSGIATGSYATVNAPPANGMIIPGNVGIGTTTPASPLEVDTTSTGTTSSEIDGISIVHTVAPTANQTSGAARASIATDTTVPSTNTKSIDTLMGVNGYVENNGTGTLNKLFAVSGYAYNGGAATLNTLFGGYFGAESDVGTVGEIAGFYAENYIYGGTVTNAVGLKINSTNSGGTVTNRFGIYIAPPTGTATNDFGIYVDGTMKNYFKGIVGIGTTSPAYSLDVRGGQVAGAGAFVNTSDVRLKKDIEPIQYGLDTVLKLRPVGFNWIDQSQKWAQQHQIGLIAQEAEQVVPEIVSTADDADHMKSIAYGAITPILIKAVQDIYNVIKNLAFAHDQEISALKQENAAIKAYLCSKEPNAPICH